MLDLETLAENRARVLKQPEQEWRDAVWTEDFQNISRNMTDGEVEEMISLCPTVFHLNTIVKYLNVLFTQSGESPFTLLVREATSEGLKPAEWIASKVQKK